MKHNRWLIYLVAILLIINLGVFFALKYYHADDFLKKRIAKIIENSLNANVSFSEFSINDKQIFISNLNLIDKEGSFKIKIKNVYVDYNLLHVILSQFSSVQIVKDVRIYDPQIDIKYVQKQKSEPFKIPDISDLFKRTLIENAKINLSINTPKFSYSGMIDSIDVIIENKKQSRISLNAKSSNHAEIILNSILQRDKLIETELNIRNLPLNNFQINGIASLNTYLNASLNYKNKSLTYALDLNNPEISLNKNYKTYLNFDLLALHDFHLNGTQQKAKLDFVFDTNNHFNGKINAYISNPFTKPLVNADLSLIDYSLPEISQLKGHVSLQAKLDYYKKINVKALIVSDSVSYLDETFKNISINANTHDLLKADIAFTSDRFSAFNGFISSTGIYNLHKNSLALKAEADSVRFHYKGLDVKTSLQANLNYTETSYKIDTYLKNADLKYKDYVVNSISGKAYIKDNLSNITISNADKSLYIDLDANTQLDDYKGIFKLNDFKLNSINNELSSIPLSGRFDLDFNNKSIESNIDLAIKKSYELPFSGKLKASFFADRINHKSSLSCFLNDAVYNKNKLSMKLKAHGNLDSLKTSEFTINDILNIESSFGLKPTPFLHLALNSQKIPLKELAKFVLDENTNRELKGYLNLLFDYDSRHYNSVYSKIQIDSLQYDISQTLNVKTIVSGPLNNLKFSNLNITHANATLANLSAEIINLGEKINISGKIDTALDNLFDLENLNGTLKMEMSYTKQQNQQNLKADLNLNDFSYLNYQVKSIDLSLEQKDNEFILNKFLLNSSNIAQIEGSGSINYNILTDQYFNSLNSIKIQINANPLLALAKNSKLFLAGDSHLKGYVDISMNEDGIFLKDGELKMTQAFLKIKDQQELLDKINLLFLIKNNQLEINDFSMRMGNGHIYVDNKISNTNEDLQFGPLNLGQFLLKTDKEGLLFHLPYYMAKNSVANVVVKGRNNDAMLIKGPFDDIQIIGDFYFSNGSGIYPSDSENLLQYMSYLKTNNNNSSENTNDDNDSNYPFSLDLMLRFTNNMRYVTYPLNLLINPDSYLWLTYKNGNWSAYEAQFTAESGDLEMFGTNFKADYISVKITPYESYPIILGSFYQKTSDGTIITLDVLTGNDKDNFWKNLEFKLKSDNTDDKSNAQILSKLRYGKSLDELSQQQQQSILQDEALQLVGVSLGSAFIDPYLSPIENKVRKWLRLDTFNFNPGFVQNLFNEYKSDNNTRLKTEYKDAMSLSSSILLNNLSVNMGKYVTNNMFLNYEALFQEESDILSSRLYMYNTISMRYDLPLKFKFLYEYQILPNHRKDAHEIMIMRSFKF